MKRTERQMPEETKTKISATLKAKNLTHSKEWNQKISDGQKKAWAKIPKTKEDLSMDEFLGSKESTN